MIRVLVFLYYLQLGDPENKGASNADFHLSNLLSDHPNMKVKQSSATTFKFSLALFMLLRFMCLNLDFKVIGVQNSLS